MANLARTRARRSAQAQTVGWLAQRYARLLGATVEQHGVLRVCRGLPRWAYPRGGVTFGDAYLTGRDPGTCTPRRLQHEAVHVEQWRREGLRFAWSYLRAGRDPQRNRYEIEAGLADGGYR